MIFVINLDKLELVSVTGSKEQAFYLADILCKKSNYHVDEFNLDGFKTFSTFELRKLFESYHGHQPPESWDQLTLIGSLLNLEDNLINNDSVEGLHKVLKRAPKPPKIANVRPLQDASVFSVIKPWCRDDKPTQAKQGYPKPGTTSSEIWLACDQLLDELNETPVSAQVVARMKDTGFNVSTIRTQYGHWKRFKQL